MSRIIGIDINTVNRTSYTNSELVVTLTFDDGMNFTTRHMMNQYSEDDFMDWFSHQWELIGRSILDAGRRRSVQSMQTLDFLGADNEGINDRNREQTSPPPQRGVSLVDYVRFGYNSRS